LLYPVRAARPVRVAHLVTPYDLPAVGQGNGPPPSSPLRGVLPNVN
jgi:hypothetical protein